MILMSDIRIKGLHVANIKSVFLIALKKVLSPTW